MNTTLQRKIAEWKLAFYSMEDAQSNNAKILSGLIELAKSASSVSNTASKPISINVSLEK